MRTYKVCTDFDEPTITKTHTVTHQQGSWKWQIRLCCVLYAAQYSPRVKAWLWKSQGQVGGCFSGGNTRGGSRVHVDGSAHNIPLSGVELAALAVVRGES